MLDLQKLTSLRSSNYPVGLTKYCNNHPKIANLKKNILKKTGPDLSIKLSEDTFHDMVKILAQSSYQWSIARDEFSGHI